MDEMKRLANRIALIEMAVMKRAEVDGYTLDKIREMIHDDRVWANSEISDLRDALATLSHRVDNHKHLLPSGWTDKPKYFYVSDD